MMYFKTRSKKITPRTAPYGWIVIVKKSYTEVRVPYSWSPESDKEDRLFGILNRSSK